MTPAPLTLTLQRSQFMRVPQPRGVRVAVERGTLWITIDGQARDIELRPGAELTFDDDAPALIGVFSREAVFRALAPALSRGDATLVMCHV